MPELRSELKAGNAYKQVHGVIAHAMNVHHEREHCDFDRTAEELADEVFEFLVSTVERAEKNCPLHQQGGTTIGFTGCENVSAGFTTAVAA